MAFTSWIEMARNSGIEMLSKFSKTPEKHFEGILAYFDFDGLSTGPLEGTNNKIKTMQRKAYGYRDSEFKYRSVLESTSTVPWEVDLKSGAFTFMGNQIEVILGYPADSWKDLTLWAERLHPEDRDDAVEFSEVETKKGQDHDFIYRALHTDGSYRWIRDIVSVIAGETGPEKLVGFMHDITEEKELTLEKEQLKKQREQSQKLEAIGTLAVVLPMILIIF